MNASMTQFARGLDWSAMRNRSMRGAILRFVYGIHDRRKIPVTLAQIKKWFSGTRPEFVSSEVDGLVEKGLIVMQRTGPRRRCGYVYDITYNGVCYMRDWTYWDTPEGRRAAGR